MNKLKGSRCYLCGPIEASKDGGYGWRKEATKFLKELGVVVLDPLNKPLKSIRNNEESLTQRKILKEHKLYDDIMQWKNIRQIDLRLVDIADFLVVNLNMEEKPCGTIEEISLANRQKKPILIYSPLQEGKQSIPDWIFWMVSPHFIFDSLKDIFTYLKRVKNEGDRIHKRWVLFDYEDMSCYT